MLTIARACRLKDAGTGMSRADMWTTGSAWGESGFEISGTSGIVDRTNAAAGVASPGRDHHAAHSRGTHAVVAPRCSTCVATISVAGMRLLLVAYPGAGKGTQADRLAEHYKIAHLSSGALLRAEVTQATRIGRIAAEYLERGDLVPDDLVFDMMSARVLEAARNGGYVLDGFPRTLHQAEEAYALARDKEHITLQAVIYLRAGIDELRNRLRVRAHQEGRNDDTEVGIAHRFEVFDAETQPLLGFYAKRGILVEVDGEQTIDKVFADVTGAIDRLCV